MNQIVTRIKQEFQDVPDLKIKEIQVNRFHTLFILYLETISSSDRIHNYILKNLSTMSAFKSKKNWDISSVLPGPNTTKLKEVDQLESYLNNGFTVIIDNNEMYAIETRADIHRSIGEPSTEPAINGPKDAFTENYQTNLGLIKRRIKSNHLKTKEFTIGRLSSTKIGVLYIDNVANLDILSSLEEKINKIDIDGLIDVENLGHLLIDEDKTHFPTYLKTERPDNVSNALLEGKIIITMDTSPFCIIIPGFFADFINPGVDKYNKSNNINFLKILRFCAFFLSMMVPAIYIAFINYNEEAIPTDLLVSIRASRIGLPFPSVVEAIIMLLICEMLRESDIRFPSSYGSAISILGALVLGEAAVAAGIVSPIMIIMIALTFMASLVFTETELIHALRHFRFLFIFLACFYGLLGILFGLIYFFIKVLSVESFHYPYFYPLIPFNKPYFFKTILKNKEKDDTLRSNILSKNRKKQGENN